jgi:predicted DNA-binding transcriptional regulator YafY
MANDNKHCGQFLSSTNGRLEIVLETSARLLRLLSCFQARRYWAGAELVTQLEITPRTLRRDVDRLRVLGYPVESTPGPAGGYQLRAGATLPPLLLDDDEAVAVAVGLATAAQGGVSGLEEISVRALAKVEQVLPLRLRRRVRALHSFIVPLSIPGPTVEASTLSAIAGACRDSETLRFTYHGRDAAASAREVEPHWLVHTGHRWYLVAWDRGREDWRTFRADRIDGCPAAGLRFTPRKPPDNDLAAYVSRSLAYAPYPYRARVLLHAPLETMTGRIPPSAGTLARAGAKRCTLDLGAKSLDRIAVYLALAGVDFEVQDPPELREHMRVLASRFTRAAKGGTAPGASSSARD